HVLNNVEFCKRRLYELSKEDLADWVRTLPADLKPSTKERIATDFKAALNYVAKDSRHSLPAEFRMWVQDGLKVEWEDIPEARDGQALSDLQIKQILAAAAKVDAREQFDGDLHRIF